MSGTTLAMSSAYHLQSDGQIEVLNRTIQQYLRCFVMDRPTSWVKLLPWAEFAYNISYHEGAGMTPFEVVYRQKPPIVPDYVRSSSSNEAVDQEL